jgi:tetratricopeptide (TPR) repeat protein
MASSARIEELRKKFEENPRRYFAPLANEYRKAGDIEQAIAICREYLPQQPGHMSGHIVYGQALYEARQVEEAKTVFETALALDPENLIALRHLGDLALMVGDAPAARMWYGRVLEADPRNEEIQAQLASLDQPGGASAATASTPTPSDSAAAQPPVAPAKPTPSSAPTVVVSAQPKLQPWAKKTPVVPTRTVPTPVVPTSAVPTPVIPTRAVPTPPVPMHPVTAQSPTAEIVLDALPTSPTPAQSATAQSPTAEILLDALPAASPPPVERAGEMALGLEPTSIQTSTTPSPASSLGIDLPVSQSQEAPPIDSFSLEGLETTSLASTPPASAPTAAAAMPLTDLDFGTPPTPAPAQAPARNPTPVAPIPAVTQAEDDPPLLDIGEIPAAPAAAPATSVPVQETRAAEPLFDAVPEPAEATPPASPAMLEDWTVSAPVPETIAEARVVEEPVPAPESGPFVTETMAELYLQQGHREEALKVYRRLLDQRPDDALLLAKVEALSPQAGGPARHVAADQGPSIRDLLSAIAARRPGFRQEFQPKLGENGETAAADHVEAESHEASSPHLHTAAPSVSSREPVAPPEPDSAADALATLFGGAKIAAADEGAATALAYAFVALDGLESGTGAPEEIRGAPARHAGNDLSLDAVFKGDAPSPPPPSFSFDQFFSQRATAEQPIQSGIPAASGAESRDDVAQFTQWLEGLKQR